MSKRFGRNQKRAMRAIIAEQSTELRDVTKRLDSTIATQRPMRETLDEVARVLGRHFMALPPVQRYVDRIPERYRMPIVEQVPAFIELANQIPTLSMASYVDMAVHSVQADSLAMERLKGSMHVLLRTDRGDVGYAISEQAMNSMNPDRLSRLYVPMIAEAFAQQLTCGRAQR